MSCLRRVMLNRAGRIPVFLLIMKSLPIFRSQSISAFYPVANAPDFVSQ